MAAELTIEEHVAAAIGVSVEAVQKSEPCPCCGMHLVYAKGEQKVALHPWGGKADFLDDCIVVRSPREASDLIDHVTSGPRHPMFNVVVSILTSVFAS